MKDKQKEEGFKSGFVAILGRPNVGKSTLLNAFLGDKVSIISNIPQTTRHQIRGILHLDKAQVIFVDTPGIHSFKEDLAAHLNIIAKKSTQDVELILYVVDTSRCVGEEEKKIMQFVLASRNKVVMALNKIDLGGEFLNQYIDTWRMLLKEENVKKDPVEYYIPISAVQGTKLEELIEVIKEFLSCDVPFYEKDSLTDFPLKFRIADIIREKLFLNLKKELPHSLAVEVQEIEDKEKIYYIRADIYVNRDSQKKIVIGRGGSLIKQVGILCREDLEILLKKKVYLELRVKVIKDWQNKIRILKELGYWWA